MGANKTYMVQFYRDTGGSWQQSVSHIFPKYQFSAKDDEMAVIRAAAFARKESCPGIDYKLQEIFEVRPVKIDKEKIKKKFSKDGGLDIRIRKNSFTPF